MSAYCALAETALTSIGTLRLRNMLDEKLKNAELVEKLLSDKNKLLSTILVANNIVNLSAAAIATSLAISLAGNEGWAIGLATAIATFLIIIFGEITPKTFAVQNTERICLAIAKPTIAMIWLLAPVVRFIGIFTDTLLKLAGADPSKTSPSITESEFRTMVAVGHEEGVIEEDERQMIHNVFEFGQNNARDVMIQRMDMVVVEVEESYDEIREKFETERFSRMPVYRDSIDDIIGVLHLQEFAFCKSENDEFKVENFMRKPFFTYESKPLDELFNLMRSERLSIAIVLDEYGGTAGMITLEDLIEEIVGEIEDEYDDTEEDICKINDNEYLVEGSTKLDDLNEVLNIQLESEDFESIGGYVMGIVGNIPEQGEIVIYENMTFTIEAVDKNRILKLRICTKTEAETEECEQ